MGYVSFIFVLILVFVYPIIMSEKNGVPLGTPTLLIFVLTLSAVYTGIFSIITYIYERLLWKLFNPRYNFSGHWHMKITYEFLERKSSRLQDKLNLPYSFESVFVVRQNIVDLSFAEGFSAPNEIWRDTSLRLTSDGICMSYEVNRTDRTLNDALPPRMLGLETVEVTERDRLGRPKFMIGRMYHAAIPETALYRGTTTYQRIKRSRYKALLEQMRNGTYQVSYEGETHV